MNIEKNYDHIKNEEEIYSSWESSGFLNPDNLPGKRKDSFTIIMPPPNANDPLHMGHAVFVTVEDVMIRYNRMKGKKTLWLPGTDHAGFETQVVYEKKLEKEGMSRFQMTREDFYKRVWDYTSENKKIVKNQLKKLGASADWSRESFTLDEKIIKTVYKTFKKMVDDGLIYRGERLVNFCTKHKTAFSDLEIEKVERKDPLYYMKYGPIILATTRPETKFGDTAIAVHPKDERYKKYINKKIKVKTLLGEKEMIVIADDFVDPEFGTGAVKITPAHDFNDFDMWQKHKKEMPDPIQVINDDGKLNSNTGIYEGLKVEDAREVIVKDMQKNGLIEKIDHDYTHSVSVCYKCKKVIEPMLKKQWFIKAKNLSIPAIKAVRNGSIQIIPKNSEKIYFHWLKNIRDWNISRQNWWGISIPAWRCKDCSDKWIITDGKEPKFCPDCKGKNLEKDSDVFDTWFSSSQWPFASLGYPDSKDFKNFYPTSVMETGYDILFFWVARMVMMGIYTTKKIPFKTIYLHGLIRDKERRKMSKSKGNVIDPLAITDVYGTDSLRLALIIGSMPGKDASISEEKIKGYRNFINKIWNIYRFISLNIEDYNPESKIKLTDKDKKILDDFDKMVKKVSKSIDRFRFSEAAETIYHYSWHVFADKVIEKSKPVLLDEKTRFSRQYVLIEVFGGIIKTLHPFAPFITEKIYQQIPLKNKKSLLIIEDWPYKK
jgi:valyl-tRNA synthetase